MKLSFSVSSKQSKLHNKSLENESLTQSVPNIEFVTEFDSTKTLIDPSKPKIAPLPNQYNPRKKMKNIETAIQQTGPTNPQFEVINADLPDQTGPDNISFGLNLRKSGTSNTPKVSVDAFMLQKLRQDLKDLPDVPGMDDYEEMPVEGFGAALMAGYGWREGMGIGRNAKEDVKIVQYERRTAKEGLGFVAEMPSVNEKAEKVGDEGRGGGEREVVGRFQVGEDVRVVNGRNIGLKGIVVKVLDSSSSSSSVVLRLSRSEEEVKVKIRDIAELGSSEEERCLRKLKELKIQRSKDGKERRENKRDREVGRRSEQKEDVKVIPQVPWLQSHIRVRIISKDLKGGRLYLKKGTVVDVVGPTTCDITMDESGELVQGVGQDLLETALPRTGGPVLVLYGKHKGVYGSLLEKDMDREKGVVRDADSHALLNVPLEQIAEYTGDPELIDY